MNNNNHMALKHPSIRLVLMGTSVGICSGIVTLLYRLLLGKAESISFHIYGYLRTHLVFLPLWFVVLILLALFVGWCNNQFPMIGGSGIPQVKSMLAGYIYDNPRKTLVAKFFVGLLSIVAGLSLGREGPSIQLGACTADIFAEKTTDSNMERKLIMASGAGAGLSAAFGAPLSAVIFTIEELYGYITPVLLLTTMTAAVAAQCLGAFFFGLEPVFDFQLTDTAPLSDYYILILLGIITGICGAFYNYFLIITQNCYNRLPFAKGITKCILAFVLAGIFGIAFPYVLCGGHELLEFIKPDTSMRLLFLLLGFKFLFSMVSFESGAPGGIFFPLLVMGSLIGAIFGKLAIGIFDMPESYFYGIIVLSMAGFFTAIVRAPLTGIVLLMEMTGSFAQLLPFTIVSIVAYIIAYALKSEPIYETLMLNLLQKHKGVNYSENSPKVKKSLFEIAVTHSSPVVGKTVMELSLPDESLIVSIRRNGMDITPGGSTIIQEMDLLVILSDITQEWKIREQLE